MPRARTLALVSLLVLAALLFAGWSALAVKLPTARGEHAVGRVDRLVVDEDRPALVGEGPRELMVTIYYPAATSDGPSARYVEGELAREMAREDLGAFGYVPGIWSRIDGAVLDAPPAAEGVFPVVLFSPGIDVQPHYYSSLLADVASHGYVVAAVSHTHTTPFVQLPDGRIERAHPAGLTEAAGPNASEAARQRVGAVWTADLVSVVDALAAWNATDERLAGRLDLARVAAAGHSFGGAAAAEAAVADARIRAVIDMDGTPFANATDQGVPVPALLLQDREVTDEDLARAGMTREMYERTPDHRGREALLHDAQPGSRVTLRGFGHMTFALDLAAFSTKVPGGTDDQGTIRHERAAELLDLFVVGFLDRHLRGEDVPRPEAPEASMLLGDGRSW